jgi:hypothetical protein
MGGQLSQLVERPAVSAALQSSFLNGSLALWRGNLSAAESLLARALASPVTVEEADRPYGVNPVVASRSFEGLRRWVVGDPRGAGTVQQEAVALAERHGRPFTLVQALVFSAIVRVLDEEWADAEHLAARASDVADEYGFPRWEGTARATRGRALIEMGDMDRGLAEIQDGMEALRRSGLRLGNSILFSFYAARAFGCTASTRGSPPPTRAGPLSRHGRTVLRGRAVAAPCRAARGMCRPPDRGHSRSPGVRRKAQALARAQGAHRLERRAISRNAKGKRTLRGSP